MEGVWLYMGLRGGVLCDVTIAFLDGLQTFEAEVCCLVPPSPWAIRTGILTVTVVF